MSNALKGNIDYLRDKAQNISILYVEDEEELRKSVTTFLSKIFLHVESASNGKVALGKYLQKKYDIVITDIQMPVMGGVELIGHIRKHREDQEIIVVSAYTDAEYLAQFAELNITSYIIKPIDFNQILKILKDSVLKLTA